MTREGPPAVMPVAIAEPCAARGPTRGAQKLSIGNGHGSLLNKLASVNKSKAVAHPKPPLSRSFRTGPTAFALPRAANREERATSSRAGRQKTLRFCYPKLT